MATIKFTIRLTSDGEPGTGLGGEVLNELVPRDHRRRPAIPASHVKGLMRAAFQEIARSLNWDSAEDVEARVFGSRDEIRPGVQAAFRLSNAVADKATITVVTRTAVEEQSGVAKDATLRTTEVVAVGTVFRGEVYPSVRANSVEDLAWRLALSAIAAIGGNRNRGSGACVVEIDGEQRGPGKLLKQLVEALAAESRDKGNSADVGSQSEFGPFVHALADKVVVLRLVFSAGTPVCCPEIADKTNVISTGFSIPASAVQGAILTRLGNEDGGLASALFANPLFRAWPLQPCHPPVEDGTEIPANLPTAIRVSLTHRVAKFSEPDKEYEAKHFFDEALETQPYDWREVAGGAPLKASDGVLLRWSDDDVRLWKATSMPHVITAHGVHSDPETENGRNLFSVDAMAPMVWQGLVVMPEGAAERLMECLKGDPLIAIGKSRSVRGIGQLVATFVGGIPPEWQTYTERTVLVVQSPLLLADEPRETATAEQEFFDVAVRWTRTHSLPAPAHNGTWANFGIRFGWNRHHGGRQQASRVALPGCVIAFETKLDDATLAAALRSGIGGGRDRGFGAVSVHPGKAKRLFSDPSLVSNLNRKSAPPFQDAVRRVLEMTGSGARLPSPSQIRAVQQRLLKADPKAGPTESLEYLDRQTRRTSRIWFTWEPIHTKMRELLTKCEPSAAARALEVLADLAAERQKTEERR